MLCIQYTCIPNTLNNERLHNDKLSFLPEVEKYISKVGHIFKSSSEIIIIIIKPL